MKSAELLCWNHPVDVLLGGFDSLLPTLPRWMDLATRPAESSLGLCDLAARPFSFYLVPYKYFADGLLTLICCDYLQIILIHIKLTYPQAPHSESVATKYKII